MKLQLIVITLLALSSCSKENSSGNNNQTAYKQQMRDFVISISQYAKRTNPKFLIVPQNGIELVSSTGNAGDPPATAYLHAIDANGQEDLFYGYNSDDEPTTGAETAYLKDLLNISKAAGKTILVTDYCSTASKMSASYLQNNNLGYISFAANQRELHNIPAFPNPVFNENAADVTSMSQVKNFLYLINPANYSTKASFINSVTATNYDLLIMDLYFTNSIAFTTAEINQLKRKANGGKRLVISYMSVGEAENYRYYWQPAWSTDKPVWLDAENPDWPGNFKVKYWDPGWQQIIYGNNNSYLQQVLNASFDGVYLDIIDAFEYYEK